MCERELAARVITRAASSSRNEIRVGMAPNNIWAASSFGRAPPLQGGGAGFEPPAVHNKKVELLLDFFVAGSLGRTPCFL